MTPEKRKTKEELKIKRRKQHVNERLVEKSPMFKCKICSKVCKYRVHHIWYNHLKEFIKGSSKISLYGIRKDVDALYEEIEKEEQNVIQLSRVSC